MPANPDFRDLFAAFNAAQVKYLLVGGYALAFHGRPRFTKDLDVWLEPDAENAARAFLPHGHDLLDLGLPKAVAAKPGGQRSARIRPSY